MGRAAAIESGGFLAGLNELVSGSSFAPAGLVSLARLNPGLAPWAAFCRRFAAWRPIVEKQLPSDFEFARRFSNELLHPVVRAGIRA